MKNNHKIMIGLIVGVLLIITLVGTITFVTLSNKAKLNQSIKDDSYYEEYDKIVSQEVDNIVADLRELYRHYNQIPSLKSIESGKIVDYSNHAHGDGEEDSEEHNHLIDEGELEELSDETLDVLLVLDSKVLSMNDYNGDEIEYIIQLDYSETIEYTMEKHVLYQIVIDRNSKEILSTKRLF